jgi:ribonucleotide monophosphatase NagD (HAD superfamily)
VKRTLKITDLSSCWMVGDRYSTDGAFAKTIGAKFALVSSGVVDRAGAEKLQHEHKFEIVVDDLLGLVKHLGITI